MANYTKSTAQVLLAHTLVTHPGDLKGSSVDVSAALAVGIYIDHASIETGTPTAGALPELHIEANPFTTEERWDVLPGGKYTFSGTAPTSEALTQTEPSGETDIEVTSTAEFPINSGVYIHDPGTPADGEWARIRQLATGPTRYIIKDGLITGKDSSDTIFDQADQFYTEFDLQGIHKLRGWYVNRPATGNNTLIRVTMVITTAIG